jgi:hyaluronate lyase
MYKGAMLDMVRGRAISRPAERDRDTGHGVINSIIQLSASAPEPYASKFKSLAKYMIQADTNKNHLSTTGNLNYYKNAKAILENNSIVPKIPVKKHYIFPNMDRVVHHGSGFAFGISMFSSRITNFESMNNENLNGWYTSSGMTYLYNDDLEQYTDDFWPTVNPYRLPGTTVDTILKNPGKDMRKLSKKDWVGGTSILGLYGATGMEMQDVETTLTARKSWFNFDDEIVALGSGINSTDNRTIETTIENRKLNVSGSNALIVNGVEKTTNLDWSENINEVSWVNLQGNIEGSDIGYYFPNSASIKALREKRTGNWSKIGTTNNLPDTTKNYFTMWFDHGQNPVNATYEYVILPNKTSIETAAYVNAPDISIIKNTNEVHAVKENKLNILAANFWTDSEQSADYITVNKKASVMLQITEEYLELSVSDPTMINNGTIEISLDQFNLSLINPDSRIIVSKVGKKTYLSVNVANTNGQAVSVKFKIF